MCYLCRRTRPGNLSCRRTCRPGNGRGQSSQAPGEGGVGVGGGQGGGERGWRSGYLTLLVANVALPALPARFTHALSVNIVALTRAEQGADTWGEESVFNMAVFH